MPQTRFVLRKAFEYHLKPIVVINKIDRPDARPNDVLNEVFDMFVELDADDEALEFKTIYASARDGWATLDPKVATDNVDCLFDALIQHIPAPKVDVESPLQMLVTTLDRNNYVGRIGIGRVFRGTIRKADQVVLVKRDGHQATHKVGQLLTFDGLGRLEAEAVQAGDICAISGIPDIDIGDTVCDPEHPEPMPLITVEEPTLHMTFRVNDSPMAGRSGKYLTSRHIRERLDKELESNVSLRVANGHTPEEFLVSGRGMLHLSTLIETMRREGYELAVGKPKVIYKELDGKKTEPVELLVIDVPAGHVGSVMELLGTRRAECQKMDTRGGQTHMEFTVPARGLIGLRNRLLTATNGEAIMHHNFYQYEYFRGSIPTRTNGAMIASDAGQVTAYALDNLQQRGVLFVGPQMPVYVGQVVGESAKDGDMTVNVCRGKKMTNIRAAGSDKSISLKPPRDMSLEIALEFIEDDELVEVTPDAIRLRKRMLKETDRKRQSRAG